MTMLDGYEVALGNKVFAVGLGRGTVTELLTEGRFAVQFEINGKNVVFDSEGKAPRAPYRTLYWRDPVLVNPMKDDARWNRIKPVMLALINAYTVSG